MSAIVEVPLHLQLLCLAVTLQLTAFVAVLWRGIFGLKQLSTRRPRWPFIPLIVGAGLGVWYAVLRMDLLFGVAQALGLFIGFCLINSTRGTTPPATSEAKPPRTDKREKRAARKKERSGEQ
jgi:hypothetical protein